MSLGAVLCLPCCLPFGELVCPQLEHLCEPWCFAAACVCPQLEHPCEPVALLAEYG